MRGRPARITRAPSPAQRNRNQPDWVERTPRGVREKERMMGLEPTTFCMASRRSSQLSYIRAGANYSLGSARRIERFVDEPVGEVVVLAPDGTVVHATDPAGKGGGLE